MSKLYVLHPKSQVAFEFLKHVHTLNISGCDITDNVFENLKNIRNLNMSGCAYITDETFKYLKNIHTLDITMCE